MGLGAASYAGLCVLLQEQRNAVARFLDARDMKQEALEIATDPDYRFDLAVSLGELGIALELAEQSGSELKWRQLGELALSAGKLQVLHLDHPVLSQGLKWSAWDIRLRDKVVPAGPICWEDAASHAQPSHLIAEGEPSACCWADLTACSAMTTTHEQLRRWLRCVSAEGWGSSVISCCCTLSQAAES